MRSEGGDFFEWRQARRTKRIGGRQMIERRVEGAKEDARRMWLLLMCCVIKAENEGMVSVSVSRIKS